ncbi:uncharacterized protein LOC135501653 [Lineus longissimus]|uniref:uncharacterized protein LOC135493899 n=1 Tax=Lineus longissimus TaxID=88925 RepID=UPI002B4CE3B1
MSASHTSKRGCPSASVSNGNHTNQSPSTPAKKKLATSQTRSSSSPSLLPTTSPQHSGLPQAKRLFNTPTKSTTQSQSPATSNPASPSTDKTKDDSWQDAIFAGMYYVMSGQHAEGKAKVEKGVRVIKQTLSQVTFKSSFQLSAEQDAHDTTKAELCSAHKKELYTHQKLMAANRTIEQLNRKILSLQQELDQAEDTICSQFDAPETADNNAENPQDIEIDSNNETTE